MLFTKTPTRLLGGGAIVTLGAGTAAVAIPGVGSSKAALSMSSASASAAAPARRAVPQRLSRVDQLTVQAQRRYGEEVHGSVARTQLRHIAADPHLLAALRSGNLTTLRTYVRQEFNGVWYHRHVSRLRIVRGSQILSDVGVPFVVAPSQTALRDAHGRVLATLQISIQDEIGYVRYMHRNFPVDVVVRGRGAGHVRTSLPAATAVKLPASGTVTVGGRRLAVRSFHATALGGEPVTVWILAKA
jgi:hypothetical protein